MGNYSKILMFKLPNERGLGVLREGRLSGAVDCCSSAIEKDEFNLQVKSEPTKVEKERIRHAKA